MRARRSPVAVGIVLGLLVGAGAAVAIAATSSEEGKPSSAPARAVLPQSTVPAPGSIERVAVAFDMHGPLVTDAEGWTVRDGHRVLRVQRSPGLPWFLSTADASCVLVPESPPSSEPLPTVPPSGPTECPEETPLPDVSKDDALALATDTLTRAGLGDSTTEIVDEPGGWYIQAEPRVEGKAGTGLPWTISIGPGRSVIAASGYLAAENR